MKKRIIATFARSDGRSKESIKTYVKTFDSYEKMIEYLDSQQFTTLLFWWYLPEWRMQL